MNITKISLTNFLSHKQTVFNVSQINPVIVVGDNGAGKSSLIKDSITWTLFGKARASNDDIISNGEQMAEGRITFALNNITYEVVRWRERNRKTGLHLFENDNEITGATIAETQNKISTILGMTYETFTCTACIEQGKVNSFSSLTPKEAKRVIMDILQLGVYDTYFKQARDKANTLAAHTIKHEGQQSENQDKLDAIQKTISEMGDQKDKLETLHTKYTELKERIIDIDTQLNKADVETLASSRERSKLLLYLSQLTDVIKNVRTRVEKLERAGTKGKCPLCLTLLTPETIDNILGEFTKRVETYTEELAKVEQKIKKIDRVDVDKKSVRNQLVDDRRDMELVCESINKSLQEVNDSAGFLRAKEEELESIKSQIGESGLKIKQVTRLWSQYKVLVKAFDRNGIPTLIIENVIPEIEETSNQILSLLSNNSMSLELKTQRELKTGGTGDTLDIVIRYLTNTRSYETLSGGERFRVDLALRIALSKVLVRRNSFKCETLLIDEGMGSLDEIGKEKFCSLAMMLRDTFKRIIIVTHTDVKDRFSNVVRVEKVDGESKVILTGEER